MFSQWSVAKRLGALVAALLACQLFIALMGMRSSGEMLDRFSTTYQDRVIPLDQLKRVSDAYAVDIVDATHKVRDGALTPAEGLQSVARAREAVSKNWQAYTATYLTDEEKQLVVQATARLGAADNATAKAEALMRADNKDGLRSFAATEMYPAIDPLTAAISSLMDLQLRVAGEEFAQAQVARRNSLVLNAGVLLVAIALGSGLAYKIIHHLLHALGAEPDEVSRVASRVAAGDLSGNVSVRTGYENSVMGAMASMHRNLRDLATDLNQSASEVTASSHELSAAAQQVAKGSEGQADAASAIAAVVEQMAVSIETISAHSSTASDTAMRSHQTAAGTTEGVRATVADVNRIAGTVAASAETITRLTEQSQQIASVVSVIREVADQTNLLALNAAIEAARAGEQGRGFAVVADEVRKLAERTSASTGEITQVVAAIQDAGARARIHIDDASTLAGEGAKRAGAASEAIHSIQCGAEEVAQLVRDISESLAEQKLASTEIANRVEVVSQMTEENSQAAGSVSTTARTLSAQAQRLQAAAQRFRL
ncbi:methyl-accepting chemotaxis protein [Viridibacterium curvum]|uniref:Methyl-accepting chemotaxis protein n=1 Tax=Viridibacterium curvum TaxID=1101404 RepID=A0ABP9QP99_9RHOO